MEVNRPFERAGWKGVLMIDTTSIDDHSIYSEVHGMVHEAIDATFRDLGDKLNRIKQEVLHARGHRG